MIDNPTKHMARCLLVCLAISNLIVWSLACNPVNSRESIDEYKCANAAPSLDKRRQISERLRNLRFNLPEERKPGTVTIPVYFHILTTKDEKEGLVSKADVLKQIDVLNAAFSGKGKPGVNGIDTPFRFEYADMEVTPNDEWFGMAYDDDPTKAERDAKEKLNIKDPAVLNIYTARLAFHRYGWARWPWDIAKGVDGIVLRYSTLPGGSTYHFNEGDTATHEVGHWLGLFHTFEGGCNFPGDGMSDTPAEAGQGEGCPPNSNSCPDDPGDDPVWNFMDTTWDRCMYTFTSEQSEHMDAIHLEYRTKKDS